MKNALIILGGFIGIAFTLSAIGKIKRIPGAIEAISRVGVKENQYNQLAFLELLGALGLLLGIWIKPIGIAASIGIALYFIGAQTAHIRMKDSFAKMLKICMTMINLSAMENAIAGN